MSIFSKKEDIATASDPWKDWPTEINSMDTAWQTSNRIPIKIEDIDMRMDVGDIVYLRECRFYIIFDGEKPLLTIRIMFETQKNRAIHGFLYRVDIGSGICRLQDVYNLASIYVRYLKENISHEMARRDEQMRPMIPEMKKYIIDTQLSRTIID